MGYLWPEGITLDEAMRSAFNRRNQFFHVGQFPEPRVAYVDATRIRLVCERLLFAFIGGDQQWQTLGVYEESAWLASQAL